MYKDLIVMEILSLHLGQLDQGMASFHHQVPSITINEDIISRMQETNVFRSSMAMEIISDNPMDIQQRHKENSTKQKKVQSMTTKFMY